MTTEDEWETTLKNILEVEPNFGENALNRHNLRGFRVSHNDVRCGEATGKGAWYYPAVLRNPADQKNKHNIEDLFTNLNEEAITASMPLDQMFPQLSNEASDAIVCCPNADYIKDKPKLKRLHRLHKDCKPPPQRTSKRAAAAASKVQGKLSGGAAPTAVSDSYKNNI